MSTANYLDRFFGSNTDVFTPEFARKVDDIKIDDDLQAHVDSLAQKSNAGTISEIESAEYKALIDAADLISVLQLKARRYLAEPN